MSKDSDYVGSCGYDNTVRIWDIEKGNLIQTLKGHQHYIRGLCFSNDGKRVASGSDDLTIKIWGVSDPKNLSFILEENETQIINQDVPQQKEFQNVRKISLRKVLFNFNNIFIQSQCE